MTLEEVAANDDAAECEEGFVDIVASFVSCAKTSELMEPTDGPLNNPAINSQSTSMLGITFCQDRFDAPLPQHLAMRLGVVGTISLHSARTFAGTTPFAADWRNRLDQ